MPLRRSSSSTSSSLMPRVSQIHLNYESMQNELRSTQDVLAVLQEDHRETRESVNTFIAFLTFSDIYVCFTLFTLQAVVQRIPDASDIPIPTWQPPRRNRLVPQ
jgi:hypothetical protein